MTHAITILEKQGSEWTNDLGQIFPAAPLYRATCSCGWAGAVWYANRPRAHSVWERTHAVESRDGGSL